MEEMYHDQIKIDCSDSPEWRLPRIQRVIGYACALANHYGNDTLLDKVESLYDHEGTLTVGWKREPSEGEKEFFTKAWDSMIGDGCDNVEHQQA